MFIPKLLLILVSVEVIVEAHISIEIDPEDVDKIGDFFETIMFNRQQLLQTTNRSRCSIIRLTKKILCGAFQMFGIMVTLVSANLMTNKLSQIVVPVNLHEDVGVNLTSISNSISNSDEICKSIEFGCNRGLCWRSCTVEKSVDLNYNSWCFTAPQKSKNKFQQCENKLDCSACWNCSYPCVRKVSYFFRF